MKYCCDEFKEQATNLQAIAGGISLYPKSAWPKAQFECGEKGSWNVSGCCGGGCFVITGMKYCPYCGKKIKEIINENQA